MENRNSASHARGFQLDIHGMFRINSTSDPDNIRDGNSDMVASVGRGSAGLFTVTLASGFTLPEKLNYQSAEIAQAANPTVWSKAHIVKDSYSQVNRTFQIQVLKATASGDTADAASDADDNDQVSFWLRGSIDSIGTDNVT